MTPGVAARLAAAQLVQDVLKQRRTLDDAMVRCEAYKAIDGPDRAFARAMASAAFRHLGQLETAYSPFLTRPLDRLSGPVRSLLAIGTAQIWVLDTPAHAAVGETVAAAKSWTDARNASGLINAVLRRASELDAPLDELDPRSIWPDWLRAKMNASLGEQAASTVAELQASIPELHLTLKNAGHVPTGLEGDMIVPGTLSRPVGAVETLAGYGDGAWWVQDVAAALPARLLAPEPGQTVIDLCAAPGGKTLQLAAAGANVIAVDRSKPRLRRLSQNLERVGLASRVQVITADAEVWRPDTLADAVLVDAPCSALGTLRRHPEGAWIKSPPDVDRFPDVQFRILSAARDMVRADGTVIYCVCTPLMEEGQAVVTRAIEQNLFSRRPFSAEDLPGFAHGLTPDGDVLTKPGGAFQHDAFFISRLSPAST